jgi:hypothetical protein
MIIGLFSKPSSSDQFFDHWFRSKVRRRLSNRLFSKPRYFEEFLGAYEVQDRRVRRVVHEDPSIGATQKLPKERMSRKKSNIFLWRSNDC